jgi:hypothetical protein
LTAFIEAQWKIVDFSEHGTRRIVEIDDNRWFFYRPEPSSELLLETGEGKLLIKAAVREDIDDLTFQIKINNVFRNFTVSAKEETGDFVVMEDIYLNLGPGKHQVRISTASRLAYFKVFREEDVWTVPTVRTSFTPENYDRRLTLESEDSSSSYFSAGFDTPLQFSVTGPNTVAGYVRYFMNEADQEAVFDIYIGNQVVETVSIPSRRTGSYWLAENPEQSLSIGRRIEFSIPTGDHVVRFVPRTDDIFISRLFMNIPEELPESEEDIYDLGRFREPAFFQKALSGMQLTVGTSIRYNDNVFSLSDYDMDRFDSGHENFSFIKTADDLIVNPYLQIRYPFSLGELTLTPYLNANHYQYISNPDKTNYSILSALFSQYKNFNLNLYYGYYGDLYARDYLDRNGSDVYEKFEYEKNLYRLYSFFSLGRYDTPLLYFQIEEYFYNEFFTEYDGIATTYGLGWRRSFPTFYLRLFYYYRDFEASNVSYDLNEVVISDRITDTSYESNIYDLQFRNKRINLFADYDFRPYFGFRLENRYYSTKLPVEVAPFQSGREENRYRINFGLEFYLVRNLNIILDYKHYLRDTYSENDSLPKYKDYRQNLISLDLGYTINF